nr:hypothetical protein [Tanacetum cinerariifolium]
EKEIPQPLLVVSSPVPSYDDLHLTVGQAHTPAIVDIESDPEEALSEIEEFLPLVYKEPLTDEEFEASEPSDIRITSSHSTDSSCSTIPLSPDHPHAPTSPAPTRVSYYHSSARMAKRYRGTSKLVEDTEDKSLDSDTEGEGLEDGGPGSEDEGPGLEEEAEEAAPEDILINVPPVRVPVQTPPSPEWSSDSLPVLPSSPVVPTLVASQETTPAVTIAVGEDEFLEVRAQLELYGSILHDHT